ncbi:S-layer homology domain-containing protein [Candidatus Peregrinibacteria bacterium]|nr:S-layer homology domain-containing protein [Candidatus Peregrinibacteria bacterium]
MRKGLRLQVLGSLIIAMVVGNNCLAAGLGVMTRGEAVDMTVKYFKLAEKNKQFLRECESDLETCLFTYSTRTNFHEFRLKPLILYPDVYPAHKYYKSINLATKLDLVRGYFNDEESPFRPEQAITKAEALKLVLGASGNLNWKEKFELDDQDIKLETQAKEVLVGMTDWWYGRYVGRAKEKGLLDISQKVDPAANISREEFLTILEKTSLAYGQKNSEENPSANTTFQADSSSGKEV